jgi:hypothetical protein
MKTYDVVLYECSSCAYATQFAGNAARHAATIKCSGGSMSGKSHRLVKFEDVAPAETAVGRETITTVPGFECSACGYATGDRSNAAKHAKKCGAEIALAHLRVSVLSTRPRVAAPRFRMAERAKKGAAERAEDKARKAVERAEEKARKEAETAEEKARKEAERSEEKARKEAERAEEAPDPIPRFSPACCAGETRGPPPVPQRHRFHSLEARTRRACGAAERCFARSRPMD